MPLSQASPAQWVTSCWCLKPGSSSGYLLFPTDHIKCSTQSCSFMVPISSVLALFCLDPLMSLTWTTGLTSRLLFPHLLLWSSILLSAQQCMIFKKCQVVMLLPSFKPFIWVSLVVTLITNIFITICKIPHGLTFACFSTISSQSSLTLLLTADHFWQRQFAV